MNVLKTAVADQGFSQEVVPTLGGRRQDTILLNFRKTLHKVENNLVARAGVHPGAPLRSATELCGDFPSSFKISCYASNNSLPHRARFLGTISDDITKLHFPGFHADTAEWLINNRNIKYVPEPEPGDHFLFNSTVFKCANQLLSDKTQQID